MYGLISLPGLLTCQTGVGTQWVLSCADGRRHIDLRLGRKGGGAEGLPEKREKCV